MSYSHYCNECRHCFNCGSRFCETSIPSIIIEITKDFIIKKCPKCGHILEKFTNINIELNEKTN